MNKITIINICLASLYSCTSASQYETATSEAGNHTYVYECPDDFSFVARIESNKAWLFLPGKTIDLPQVQSASGSKYTGNGQTFWSKGEEAMIETSEIKYAACRNNRAKAIWEHAKLNGVDFRAVGNEPGWNMEISNKRDILLITDYGQHTYQFKSSTIKSEPHDKTTAYSASNDNDVVEVVITGTPCQDSMSGERFSSTVSVIINGKRYTGCGKPLH